MPKVEVKLDKKELNVILYWAAFREAASPNKMGETEKRVKKKIEEAYEKAVKKSR